MPLTKQERQEFLAQPHVAALAVAAGADRAPLNVPIWYEYEPDADDIWVVTPEDSVKLRHIRASGRFSLLVQRVEPSIRYVGVEVEVTGITPMTVDEHRVMAARYLPPEAVEPYLVQAEDFGPMVTVHARPRRWISADLG